MHGVVALTAGSGSGGVSRSKEAPKWVGKSLLKSQSTGFALGCLSWYESCPLLDQARTANPTTRCEDANRRGPSRDYPNSLKALAGPRRRPPSACESGSPEAQTPRKALRPASAGAVVSGDYAALSCDLKRSNTMASCLSFSERKEPNGKRPMSASAVMRPIGRRSSKGPVILDTFSVLTRMGYDVDFDERISQDPVGASLNRLRKAFQNGQIPIEQDVFCELESEVISNLCTVRFLRDGSMIRSVTVDAVRLEQGDGKILMQVGEWTEKKGFKVNAVLPGGKRYERIPPEEFMDEFLAKKLAWLPFAKFVTGSSKETFTEYSERFGMNSTYLRTTHRAHLGPRTGESGALCFSLLLEPRMDDSSEETHTGEPPPLELKIFGAIMNKDGLCVELYSWFPPALFEQRLESATKARIKKWISRCKKSLEERVEEQKLLLRRGKSRKNRDRSLGVTAATVDEPPAGYRMPSLGNEERRMHRRGSFEGIMHRRRMSGVDSAYRRESTGEEAAAEGFDFEKEMH